MPVVPQNRSDDAPFALGAGIDLSPLRQAFVAAGYTEGAVADIAGLDDPRQALNIPLAMRRTGSDTPLNTMVQLFALGQSVPADRVRQALSPMDCDTLRQVGLLVADENGLRSTAMLLPFEDLWTVRDFDHEVTGRPSPPNQVLGIGLASLMLANLTVRRKGEKMLDLGTGAGIQALLGAAHAQKVICTDTNPRALAFAALNARLNGVNNLEFRQGSLFDPVAGERFDLMVCNPPFAVSPESKFIYRDSGMPGDALSERLIRTAPEYLEEGGYGVVIFDWHHSAPDNWRDRPQSWLRSSGCDAWLLHFYTQDPVKYATNWLHERERGDPQQYATRLDEWLRYYDSLGIAALSRGAVVFRKRTTAANWFRADSITYRDGGGGCGPQILRIFATGDLLQSLAQPVDLLKQTLRLAPGHQLDQTLTAENGRWVVQKAVLRHEAGFEFAGNVDRFVMALVGGCDGRRPLSEVAAQLAQAEGLPVDRVAAATVDVMRMLLETGFLEVA